MKCCFKGCENKVFENLDKCALHCSSEIIIDEDKYLSEFNNFFEKYILAKIKNLNGLRCENWHGILQELSLKDISFINFHQNEILKEILNSKVLYITNICFPKIKNKSMSNFHYITDQFDRIFFESCFFGYDSVISESHKYYYRKCLFNRDLRIKASLMYLDKSTKEDEGKKRDTLLLHEEVYRYSRCTFSGNVNITNEYDHNENSNYNYIGFNIFENCYFENNICISGLTIEKNTFLISELHEDIKKSKEFYDIKRLYKIKSLSIKDCIFESDFKINGINKKQIIDLELSDLIFKDDALIMNKLDIINTKFKSKVEIKYRTITDLEFINSNVDKIFDIFQSECIKAKFSKSIFNDFSGFEEVRFGSIDHTDFLTVFEHVTFMDFSSFRGAEFSSGLDFSKTNLKDTPNFLDVNVGFKNTTRETFRIIKNSFDDVGNNIEANKFFSYEMRAYMIELSNKKGFFLEKVVLYSNFIISDFGRNYIRPLLILVCLLFIYVKSYIFYKVWYQSSIYTLPDILSGISEELNAGAKGFLPFARFIEAKKGFEFISVLFYILFAILIWQIVVAVKRHTQR